MLAGVLSSAIAGVDAFPVEVEVDIGGGTPSFRMVGLAEGAVREAYDRMKSAIRNSGYEFPGSKITINLAPADTRKEGSAFDLPMALGILSGGGFIAKRNCLGRHRVMSAASSEVTLHSEGISPRGSNDHESASFVCSLAFRPQSRDAISGADPSCPADS